MNVIVARQKFLGIGVKPYPSPTYSLALFKLIVRVCFQALI